MTPRKLTLPGLLHFVTILSSLPPEKPPVVFSAAPGAPRAGHRERRSSEGTRTSLQLAVFLSGLAVNKLHSHVGLYEIELDLDERARRMGTNAPGKAADHAGGTSEATRVSRVCLWEMP